MKINAGEIRTGKIEIVKTDAGNDNGKNGPHNKISALRGVFNKKSFIIISVIASYVAWSMMGGATDKKPTSAATKVNVAPVTRQDVPMQVPLVGTVVAYETVAIKSRLDSQIMDVHFHDGDAVKEGQIMFDLDDRAIKAQIGQFQAALEKEKAQLINANLQYQRALKLIKSHVVAQAQVDDAKAAYDGQLAQVGAAQANLDNARVQLTYTKITAPISGKTGTISVTRGNNVKANDTQPLVTINQISPIRVQTSVPQRYYDQVKTALSKGDVMVKAQNKESGAAVEGKLEYVDNSIDVSNGTFAARAVFKNEDEKLWPGMFVNVTLDLGVEKDALTFPIVAMQGDDGKHFVFIADSETKKAVRKPVEIARNNGVLAIVSKGVNENEQVIVDGLLRITDGAAIEIATPATDDTKSAK